MKVGLAEINTLIEKKDEPIDEKKEETTDEKKEETTVVKKDEADKKTKKRKRGIHYSKGKKYRMYLEML